MAQFLYDLEGVRGRHIKIYDRKCVISTRPTAGSFLTGNVTDGEKTIFYKDVVGVQFKKSGALIGYLQFETGSVQMNNQNSNMFSENTFTFEQNKNGITNERMQSVYNRVCDLIEQVKYGDVSKRESAVPAADPSQPSAASFCVKCGQPITSEQTFCVNCGNNLR